LRSESATAIRTQTIAQIAGPAAMAPLFSSIGDSGATAISVSENGSKFAAGFSDGKIIVGSVAGDGKLIRLAGHSSTIRALQFGPREDRLVSAGTDHSIRIWDLTKSKAEVICLPALVDGMAINVDGTVALASGDGKVTIFNIDAPSGTTTLSQDHKAAYAVAFSNDGALVASSGKDDAIFIRRLSDGSLVNRIVTGLSDLGSVSFSPDAKRIAAASVSGAVKVWDTYGDSAGTEIHAPPEKRWVVKFSGDGKLLALASWDGTARLFDGNTYQHLATIDGNDHWLADLAFAGGSSRLATADKSGTVRVWDTIKPQPMFFTVQDDDQETLWGRYSPDGTRFASGGRSGWARLYRVEQDGSFNPKPLCSIRHDGEVRSIAFSPDGRQVLSVGDREGIAENVVKLWDGGDCHLIRDFPVGADEVYGVAYSPSGKHLAWSHRSGQIELATLDGEWHRDRLPNLHGDTFFKVDFSPDGKLLASAGRDRRVIVWDVEKQKVLRELGGVHQQRVTTVRFSPNGRFIASGGPEDHIYVWDLSKQKPLIKALDVPGGSNQLAFNSDGSVFAVGSDARYISQWSVTSWEKIFQLNALVGVRSVFGFHPTRGDLAFDGENGLIRILSKRAPTRDIPRSAAVLDGLDVYFDRGPRTPDPDVAVRSRVDACSAGNSSASNRSSEQ
jgi:WD40 repeat protein